jgi:hypothetical protein
MYKRKLFHAIGQPRNPLPLRIWTEELGLGGGGAAAEESSGRRQWWSAVAGGRCVAAVGAPLHRRAVVLLVVAATAELGFRGCRGRRPVRLRSFGEGGGAVQRRGRRRSAGRWFCHGRPVGALEDGEDVARATDQRRKRRGRAGRSRWEDARRTGRRKKGEDDRRRKRRGGAGHCRWEEDARSMGRRKKGEGVAQ